MSQHFEQFGERVNLMYLNTTQISSIESLTKDLNNRFSPKVILVNHEKQLSTDNSLANLAIKYNMLYISAYQIIKQHITQKTEWGEKLLKSKRERDVVDQIKVADDFKEAEFSPVHYDLHNVMLLLKETVSQKKTNQKFVLLEGLCNSQKLSDQDDQLELRFMDELFCIEAVLGEVKAVIELKFELEEEIIREDQIEYEQFPEEPVPEEKPKAAEGEEEEEPPAEEGEEGEKKAPVFRKEDYQWTVSNRKPKKLLALFTGCKGINTLHEVKTSDVFGANRHDQISTSLDEFCRRLQDSDNADKYLFQQVIFNNE